jgi:quercetin 2,3-dioxygenase
MNTVIHRSNTRGTADHGWLKSFHTFSFANYYNPDRVHFGALRVLNDDFVAAGMGFSTHPHDNMEIITIPLEGAIEHKDSMKNNAVISEGEIQVMSTGTGITHSEFNHNGDKALKFLQIWVFPNTRNVAPRYGELKLDRAKMKNALYQVISPSPEDEGLWIHQDAWFHMAEMDADKALYYTLKKEGNGVYAFVINGAVQMGEVMLEKRDGMGITNTNSFEIKAKSPAKILLMEVPV